MPEEPNENSKDAAMDGMMKEYGRKGGPGDDEGFIAAVKRRIGGQDGESENAWPWLFSGGFWKVAALIAFLFAIGLGGKTWVVETAQPDPTQVVMVTQPRVEPGQITPVRVFVRSEETRRPVENAKVRVMMIGDDGSSRRLGSARTDENGIADLSAEVRNTVEEGAYKLVAEVRGKSGKANTEESITVRRSFRTMLSTDKPLYQPGQIIHMRALSMEADSLKPASSREVAFEVRDAKGNKVFRKLIATSEFGIASADFKLANQVNEGSYTIAVTIDDTTSEREVKVERYVLPKFKVSLRADRGYYAPGDKVRLELNADYTFGKPVAGGKIRIVSDEFIERFRTFQTVTGTTNDQGSFETEIALKDAFVGQSLNQGDAFVRFTAEVTDATGETRRHPLQVKVTNQPLRVEVFPESGELVQNVENTLYIVAAYPDGTPAKAVIYTGGGSRVETNELGIGKVKLTPDKPNLKLSLSARSDRGAEVKVTKELAVGVQVDGILLRTDGAIYRQGQTANLKVLSASKAKRVFLDVVKNGRSLATSSIELKRGMGEYAYDIPLDLAGTLQLQAYAILDNGDIARDSKLIQVHRADQLQVQAKLDAETYRPAEKAMIEFLVTSKDGSPVEAALSLAAVDEAVFALNDSRPGLEEMYFLIQEEILKPRAQFVAQPPSDFTAIPDPGAPTPELEEANVIAFAAAADPGGPISAESSSQAERRNKLQERKRQNADELFRLLVTFPFGLLIVCSLVFAGYGLSRLRFRPGESEELHLIEFQRRMRQFFWIILTATLAPPILMMLIGRAIGYLSAPMAFVIWVVLMITGTVWLGIKSAELRRLKHSSRHLSLFRQMVVLIPIVYGLSGLMVTGFVVANESNRSAIHESTFLRLTLASFVILFLLAGLIGFLRKSLSGWQTLPQRLGILVANTAFTLIPVILLAVFSKLGAFADGGRTQNALDVFIEKAERFDGDMMVAEAAFGRSEAGSLGPNGHDGSEAEPPRIRRHFPETLLWQPQLLTGADGKASLELALADSITTWRLSGSAVSRDGSLGSFERGIRVFQDFFIDIDFPTELTQGDEITIPIAIFNYLSEPQSIQLKAQAEDWYELVSDVPEKTLEASGGGVMQSSYRIRALEAGRHSLTVFAQGSKLADAVERTVRVVPNGERMELVKNGRLTTETQESIQIPANAISGGSDLFVKIYPGAFSQVVEGMDSIFRMPYGCFEQTSSTTYPNVLVLNYLRDTKQAKPELEMKALDFIAQGYQRLLSYEVNGGGFDWFGNPPAHTILTAYGLMEFVDMAKVYEVDQAVIERTRSWLMQQRQNNGSWDPPTGGIAEGAINNFKNSREDAALRSTAYIAWAVAEAGGGKELDASFDFLAAKSDGVNDAYTLALVANAFVTAGRDAEAREVIRQLDSMKQEQDGVVFWKAEGEGLTYGRGGSFDIETTALIAQAMMRANASISTAHKALAWLISQRDSGGTWHSTQATVQAMRALLMGAGSAGKIKGAVTVQISANGDVTNPLEITKENADVFHLVSLTEFVKAGDNEVVLNINREANLAYQLVAVHYEPHADEEGETEQILEIETDYETTELASRDLLNVDVTLRYNRPGFAPMTLVDLGIPPGFEIEAASFQALLKKGTIQRFEPKGRQVTLYFNAIPGDGKPLQFRYQLRAKFPVKVQAPASVAYQYYEPEVRGETQPVLLEVR